MTEEVMYTESETRNMSNTNTNTAQQQQSISRSNLNMKLVKSSNYGMTGLMLACQKGKIDEVQRILRKKKQSIRDQTRTGRYALHFCAERGDIECLDMILEADRSLINEQDEEGYSPVHLAVINGNHDVVKSLISSGANVQLLDNERHSLVHWAAVCGELDILETLLSNLCPVSTADIHSAHPIHYAAQMCGKGNVTIPSPARVQSTVYGPNSKKSIAVLRRLIEHGADVNVRDRDDREPLLWAASAGSADAILCLVNAGANVVAPDKDGLTALHCASSRGHTDCIEVLIGLCGSEVDVIDNNGCSALFYAVTLGHADASEMLLNFGSEPNRQDRKGRTPAHCGAAKGQLETLRLLEKNEGNLWIRNVRGDLPLHEAILSRRKDLVVWLLSLNPEAVNAPNSMGKTCLHLAALNNNVEMVKILIDNQADVNALMRTSKGGTMTPLDAAIHKGNSAVAKLLGLHGGLPYTSINDSATQRRLNRTLESRNESRLDATSRLQAERTLISPDLFGGQLDTSGGQMGPKSTSTPIPDGGIEDLEEGGPLAPAGLPLSRPLSHRANHTTLSPSHNNLTPSGPGTGSAVNKRRKRLTKGNSSASGAGKSVGSSSEDDGQVVDGQEGVSGGGVRSKGRSRLGSRKSSLGKTNYYSSDTEPPDIQLLDGLPKFDDDGGGETNTQDLIENVIEKLNLEGTERLQQQSKVPSIHASVAQSRAQSKQPSRIGSGKKQQQQDSDESSEDKMRRELSVEDYENIKIHRASTIETQESRSSSPKNGERSLGENNSKSEAPPKTSSKSGSPTGGSPSKVHSSDAIKSKFLSRIGSTRAVTDSDEESPKGSQDSLKKELESPTASKKGSSKGSSRVQSGKKSPLSPSSPAHSIKEVAAVGSKTSSKSPSRVPSAGSKSKTSSKSPSRVPSAGKKSTSQSPTSKSPSRSRRQSKEPSSGGSKKSTGSPTKVSHDSDLSDDGGGEKLYEKGDSLRTSEGSPGTRSRHRSKNEMQKSDEDAEIAAVFKSDTPPPPVPKHEIPRTPPAPVPPLVYEEDQDDVRSSFRSPIQRESEHLEKFATYQKVQNQSAKGPRIDSSRDYNPSRTSNNMSSMSYSTNKKPTKTRKKSLTRSTNKVEYGDQNLPEPGSRATSGATRRRHETVVIKSHANAQQNQNHVEDVEDDIEPEMEMDLEEGSERSGSLASSVDLQRNGGGGARSKAKINFSKNTEQDIKAIESRLGHRPHRTKGTDVDTPISVTQAMQHSMRKYHLERKIFQELLELKRLQIRAGKSNEQVLVKRLSDSYKKAFSIGINFREYSGPFTFRSFEKYLYDQLRLLQANRRTLPRFTPSDDLEKLSAALKKMNSTKLPFLDDPDRGESVCQSHGERQCTHTTHRCHHAAHAYTGVPCAAYIGKGRKGGFLPRVDPLRAPGPLDRDSQGMLMSGRPSRMKIALSERDDTQSPITLEVQQGSKSQIFALPTKTLDPNKNYYVSLSIKPTPPNYSSLGQIGGVSGGGASVSPSQMRVERTIDDGSISAPPPDSTAYINAEREKLNLST